MNTYRDPTAWLAIWKIETRDRRQRTRRREGR